MIVRIPDGERGSLMLYGRSKKYVEGMKMDRSLKNKIAKIIWISLTLLLLPALANAVRIKDITDIEGVRTNQLVGYGLVVGLNGTGDGIKSEFTFQSVSSMLDKMGINVDPDDIKIENVAAVMVTADLPTFSRAGRRIDVIVSSLGDAESLYGGTLLFSPLKGADGKVYAVAQGPLVIGGFSAGGAESSVQKNFPTVGRVINGAIIEKEISNNFAQKEMLTFALHNPDFTTVSRMTEVINAALLDRVAVAPDAGTVKVKVPEKYLGNLVWLVSMIEGLNVSTDSIAKVVINERTGTVVVGKDVKITTIAIAHGNLSVAIRESASVSQPLPFSDGETVTIPETDISVKEEKKKLMLIESGVSIGELVRALNLLGVSPRDLITIFQSLKASGALQAELETI